MVGTSSANWRVGSVSLQDLLPPLNHTRLDVCRIAKRVCSARSSVSAPTPTSDAVDRPVFRTSAWSVCAVIFIGAVTPEDVGNYRRRDRLSLCGRQDGLCWSGGSRLCNSYRQQQGCCCEGGSLHCYSGFVVSWRAVEPLVLKLVCKAAVLAHHKYVTLDGSLAPVDFPEGK